MTPTRRRTQDTYPAHGAGTNDPYLKVADLVIVEVGRHAKRRIYSQLLFDLTCDLMLSETIRYDTRVFGNYRTGFSLRNDLSLSSLCEIPFSDHSSIWADHFSAQLSDGLDTRLVSRSR